MTETMTGVTRVRIVTYLHGLFDEDALVDREAVLSQLEANDAPPEVRQALAERLPGDARLANLRAIWQYLPDVPVD